MRSFRGVVLALSSALVLLASGCFGGGGDGGTAACAQDSECAATERCFEKACVAKCFKIECAAGQTCDPSTGICGATATTCTADADCGSDTQRCASGSCVGKCDGVQCTGGTTCEPTTGDCQGSTATCSSDADCLGASGEDLGHTCVSGSCRASELTNCSTVPCAEGLDCLDVGGAKYCFTPCASANDCGLTGTCYGSGAIAGHCYSNFCSDQNLAWAQQATYLGACDAGGGTDGTCIGPLFEDADAQTGAKERYGLCFKNGQVAPGGVCGTTAERENLAQVCNNGLCGGPEGATQGECMAWCGMVDGQSCAPLGGTAQACEPLFLGLGGVCVPQAASPVAVGAVCTTSQTEAVCVDDAFCYDLDSSGAAKCWSWCRQDTGAPCAGTCEAIDEGEPLLGACAG